MLEGVPILRELRAAGPPDFVPTINRRHGTGKHLMRCSYCNEEAQQGAESCPKCGNPLTEAAVEKAIRDAKVDKIREIVTDPKSQDVLAANLSSAQVREIMDRLPESIKKDPKVKMTSPWIRILRLDGKKLLNWSRGSQELRNVFEEVTNNAFGTMSEAEIKDLIMSLPPQSKAEMARLLSAR